MATTQESQSGALPSVAKPAVPITARNIVAALTNTPEEHIKYVDDAVAASMVEADPNNEQQLTFPGLPLGSTVTGIIPHGAAYWTRTAVIQTQQQDNSDLNFFLKVTHTDVGGANLRGEFASMSAIRDITPDFVPVPIALGTYASNSNVHFYLCSFVEMTEKPAEVDTLPAKLAELHLKGVAKNGKYGFDVPTNQGALQQPNPWTDSWEKFFSDMMQRCFNWEQEMHGDDEEMKTLFQAIIEKVTPRLLRPLETGGREIKPRLVHGDLWDGNTSTDMRTNKPMIFDASSMYAHNEYELGAWNVPRHQIYKTYIRAYQKHFPISEPIEDVDDRLILYRLRFDMTSSGSRLNDLQFRELAREDMRYLVEKYTHPTS